jgi:hypothetical protein
LFFGFHSFFQDMVISTVKLSAYLVGEAVFLHFGFLRSRTAMMQRRIIRTAVPTVTMAGAPTVMTHIAQAASDPSKASAFGLSGRIIVAVSW